MKKFTVFFVTLAMACSVLFSGCGLFGVKVDKKDIIVWADATYWGGANEVIVSQMLSKYEAEKGIKVYFVPQSDLDTKLKSVANGAESPDVVIWDRWETVRYINENRFVCIDDYLSKSNVNLNDYLAEATQEMSKGGKQYGMPLDVDVWGLWVNKTALKSVGINKLPTTWDELRDAATALTVFEDPDAKTGMTRAGMNMKISGSFYSFMMTAGGNVLNNDGTRFTVNNDYGRSVLQYCKIY